MYRNASKQIYEIEGQINDLYYGKAVSTSSSQGYNSMQSGFGYGQPK